MMASFNKNLDRGVFYIIRDKKSNLYFKRLSYLGGSLVNEINYATKYSKYCYAKRAITTNSFFEYLYKDDFEIQIIDFEFKINN